MNRKLERKLNIVWVNDDAKRYIPRAMPDRAPGSMGWQVYDQRLSTYLTNELLLKIDDENLRTETALAQ